MRRKKDADRITLFQRIRNSLGWAVYPLEVKIAQILRPKKTGKKILRKKTKKAIFAYAILALPIIQFCIFYIGVNVNSIVMSFQTFDPERGYVWSGATNFSLIWTNFLQTELFRYCLKNSLVSFLLVQVLSVIVLLFTFFIYKKFVGYRFFKIVLFLPTIISTVITVTVYKFFCETAIPKIFESVFHVENMKGLLSNPETRYGAVMFYYMWLNFGSLMLMYLGCMNGISESVVEAARLDGATNMQEFWYITLPMIYPTFATLFYTSIAGIFTNQICLYSLWGTKADKSLWTFGYYLYCEVSTATEAGYPYLAALGLLMTVIVAPVTFLSKRLLNKIGPTVE